jgi:hypothetical protein
MFARKIRLLSDRIVVPVLSVVWVASVQKVSLSSQLSHRKHFRSESHYFQTFTLISLNRLETRTLTNRSIQIDIDTPPHSKRSTHN